jgi:transcriptional regulator with XRE-family HTH domain
MSQEELAGRLRVDPKSVARWESGASQPQPWNRPTLARALQLTLEELAELLARHSADPAIAEQASSLGSEEALSLRQAISRSQRVGNSTVALLVPQTENIRMKDRRLGAAVLRDEITTHIAMMESLLCHSVANQWRSQLAAVLADTATLAAWQSLDLGLFSTAWRLFERAKAASLEARSPAHYAHAMAEQAYVLMDLGMTAEAVECVAQAVAQYGAKVPARLRAWMHGVQAEVCAAHGAEHDALGALARADLLLPSGAADPDLPFLSLDPSHLARWRGHCMARLGVAGAIEDAASALEAMDHSFTRAEAGLRCDYATALAHAGERAEAGRQLAQARHLATITSSARQLRRVEAASALVA